MMEGALAMKCLRRPKEGLLASPWESTPGRANALHPIRAGEAVRVSRSARPLRGLAYC